MKILTKKINYLPRYILLRDKFRGKMISAYYQLFLPSKKVTATSTSVDVAKRYKILNNFDVDVFSTTDRWRRRRRRPKQTKMKANELERRRHSVSDEHSSEFWI